MNVEFWKDIFWKHTCDDEQGNDLWIFEDIFWRTIRKIKSEFNNWDLLNLQLTYFENNYEGQTGPKFGISIPSAMRPKRASLQ